MVRPFPGTAALLLEVLFRTSVAQGRCCQLFSPQTLSSTSCVPCPLATGSTTTIGLLLTSPFLWGPDSYHPSGAAGSLSPDMAGLFQSSCVSVGEKRAIFHTGAVCCQSGSLLSLRRPHSLNSSLGLRRRCFALVLPVLGCPCWLGLVILGPTLLWF